MSRPAAVWVSRALLWGVVAVSAAAGVAGLVVGSARPAEFAGPVDVRPVGESGVGGFAELWVASYLSVGPDDVEWLRLFYDGPLDLDDVAARSVSGASAVAFREVSSGYWSVTVAVFVTSGDAGEAVVGGPRFFEVGVFLAGSALSAVSVPAEVPAPTGGEAPDVVSMAMAAPAPGDVVADTAARFLSALLAGDGELGRYSAPGYEITAVSPPPYVDVALVEVGQSGGEADRVVRARIVGVDPSGGRLVLAYELRLGLRDGRWEVTSMGGAPTLAGAAPAEPAPVPATPTSTVSTSMVPSSVPSVTVPLVDVGPASGPLVVPEPPVPGWPSSSGGVVDE